MKLWQVIILGLVALAVSIAGTVLTVALVVWVVKILW